MKIFVRSSCRILACASVAPVAQRYQLQRRRGPITCSKHGKRNTKICAQEQIYDNNDDADVYYDGYYGKWKIEKQDVVEVWAYRVAISVVASTFSIGTVLAMLATDLPSSSLPSLPALSNALAITGSGGLGIALYLIHIYVTPLKRLLQVFWGLGVVGGTYLLLTTEAATLSLPSFVAHTPWSVWCIGPLFAALTGLTFKEGICYGKAEAFALTLLLPALLLSRLGGVEGDVEKLLSSVIAVLLVVFAARKYTQPLKDDIGDGSVFKFQKMSAEEQALVLSRSGTEVE